ncbi:HNH endonuclease [Clostridium argentinense]
MEIYALKNVSLFKEGREMIISQLKLSRRDREYKLCPEHIRDSVVYNYLFKGESHRWLDENVIGQNSSYSRGYMAMGILHYFGLANDHKGIFKDKSIHEAISILEESNVSDFSKIVISLYRYYHNDYTLDGIEYFTPSTDSPQIVKEVGTSQYTDGVRIEKEYHNILNPFGTKFYTERGSARPIKVMFNNKIFDAEYRYEGQLDKSKELQSIRFRKELKSEFKRVFPELNGTFTIQYGYDLNHFVFTHQAKEIYYPEDEENEYFEGKIAFRKHRTRERNPKVIKKAKERFMKINNGRLFCEACGFDFFEVYGERGKDFIEGHHTKFVSELSDGDMTRVEDIAMLCSNCHRMIHRKSVLTVSELAEKVEDIKRKKRL